MAHVLEIVMWISMNGRMLNQIGQSEKMILTGQQFGFVRLGIQKTALRAARGAKFCQIRPNRLFNGLLDLHFILSAMNIVQQTIQKNWSSLGRAMVLPNFLPQSP